MNDPLGFRKSCNKLAQSEGPPKSEAENIAFKSLILMVKAVLWTKDLVHLIENEVKLIVKNINV